MHQISKIFRLGAYRHRRHHSFSIIKAKFFYFWGVEHKICHFSILRRKIFVTQNFLAQVPPPEWFFWLRFNLVTNKEKPKKRPYESEEENVAVTSTKNVKNFFKPRELSKEEIEEQLIGTRTRTSLTSQYLELELTI